MFYSVKEKGYSARERRVTEHDFSRKMEIETRMAEDKEREAQRIAKANEVGSVSMIQKRPATNVVKKIGSSVIRRPLTPKIGRGF